MNLKNKDKTEDNLMSKYNLLLNMVRLLNANPLLMLYVSCVTANISSNMPMFIVYIYVCYY